MSDLFDYDNKLSNFVDHNNKNCKSCIEYEDRLIKQLNKLKTENKTLKEFADKLDEEFGKNVEPTLSEKTDNIIALYRTNKKYCEIADEKIKELQSQLDQANERLKDAIVLPFILPTYYLCGEWHTKILLGFDNYSSPKMEYFHNKEKDKAIKQAEQKLKELLKGE